MSVFIRRPQGPSLLKACIAFCSGVGLLAAPSGHRRHPAGNLAAQIDPIFAKLAAGRGPGCAVGVYHAGELVYAKGFGFADLERGARITPDTRFYIASVSKQFTAAALALLALDGKLSLDDDVRTYVPELPVYEAPITLRQLLHHTSGLRDYETLFDLDGISTADHTTDDDALFFITHQKATNFRPGTQYSYSNTGYFLASLVVRRVSGLSLPRFAKARIFDPLGMQDTFFRDDHMAIIPQRAIGYERDDDGRPGIAMSNFEQVGNGGLITTIRDLAKWDANFYRPKVGGTALLDLLRTRGKLATGAPIPYGLGIGLGEINGITRERHSGAHVGYASHLVRYPSLGLAIAVLCNDASLNPMQLAAQVAEALEPRLRPSAAAEAATGVQPPPADPTQAPTGCFLHSATHQIQALQWEGPRLMLRDSSGSAQEMLRRDERTWVSRDGKERYERASNGARWIHAAVEGSSGHLEGGDGWQPSAEALQAFAGRYASDEMPRDMQIVVEKGRIRYGAWGRTTSRELRPFARDAFISPDLFIRFERDDQGRVRGALLSAPPRVLRVTWTKVATP